MTTDKTEKLQTTNYFTHEQGGARHAHAWRYLGKTAQAYQCMECELRVTKAELKEHTDA